MPDTPYIVFEKTVIQRIEDPEKPEEFTEVTAYIPVAGDAADAPAIFANTGPEACRRLCSLLNIPLEQFGQRSYRAAPVRNWSGTEAGTELNMTFNDVLPPRIERGPETPADPTPDPAPDPTALDPSDDADAREDQERERVAGEPEGGDTVTPDPDSYPDAPGSEPEFDPEPPEPEFDPSLAASSGE